MKKFILIDAYALIHRAYHALPPLTAKGGEMVNAVFGFSSILIKTINEFKPDYMAAAFDMAEPTFRHKEYKEYKAKRPEAPPDLYVQIPRVKEILKAFGIPTYEKSGYEADDIIGTIVKKLENNKDVEILILTGDMDTLQLVGKGVKVFTPKRGLSDPILYDEKKVMERFGGLKPDQLNDFKGLKGDPSDNIPGVKGIGEKTAISLFNRYQTLEGLYKAIDDNEIEGVSDSVVEKLQNDKKMAIFSKKLSTLDRDVAITFSLEKNKFDKSGKVKNKAAEAFRELGFVSLIERLKPAGEQGSLPMSEKKQARIAYKKIPQDLSFIKLNDELKNNQEIFLSYKLQENGNLESLAMGDGESVYVLDNNFSSVAKILSDKKIKKVGCDFKPLIKALWQENINLEGVEFDAAIATYVLNPGERDYGIAKLALKEFGESVADDSDEDLALQIGILRRLKPILSARLEETETRYIFEEIEMPLIPVLAKMEEIGVKIDGKKLNKISKQLEGGLAMLEKEIYESAGEEFNINSPKQMAEILFEKLKITGSMKGGRIKKTPGGALSTNAGELEKMKGRHKIIEYILNYRELAKLKSTYADALPALMDKKGRIHTTYNQMGTATGRLSSQDPNLQNIPAHGGFGDEIRETFIAESGYQFVSIDYSQIQLRIIAALADDSKMIEAFAKGLDIHKFTAAEINNVALDKVTPEMRFAAKELNFGIIFGMGGQSFSESARISREQADKFIGEYLRDFSGVAQYMEKLKADARQNGFAVTFLGRRRYLPELNSPNYRLRSQAERIAVNMPIQGLEADIIKKAMTAIDRWARKENFGDNFKMLLQVHDELLFEVKENLIAKVTPKIMALMEGVIKLKAPITAEAKSGGNWAELHARTSRSTNNR